MEEQEKYVLGDLLKERGWTLSAAESLTGGGFGYEITSHPGSSSYFKGTICTYVNEIKGKLGVSKATLDKFGAVSKECALEMALNAQEFFGTDVAVSFTGNAGPTALENKPVGMVYIGVAIKDRTFVYGNIFDGDRQAIRRKSIEFGISVLSDLIEELNF